MKKKLSVFLCAVLLLSALVPAPAKAAWDDGLMFLAVNVKLLPLADFMPIKISGTIYVPITVFDANANGGVQLGIYNGGMNPGLSSYTLYSSTGRNLVFDLSNGLSYDYLPDGTQQNCRAVIRNSRVYVSAYSVAQYFDDVIDCTFTANTTYQYPLVRVKSKNSPLYSDQEFINSAKGSAMLDVLNKYYDATMPQAPKPTPTPEVTPTPTNPVPTPTPAPGAPDHSNIAFQLALRMETGQSPSGILDALRANDRAALLLFTPEQLVAQDDLVRRAMGEGHAIGLLVPGDSVDEARAAITRGNELLGHIGRARTRMILADGADGATLQALEGEGYLCWRANISGVPGRRTGPATAVDIMNAAENKRSLARVTMDDTSASAIALPRVLRTLREEKYDYQPMVETEF